MNHALVSRKDALPASLALLAGLLALSAAGVHLIVTPAHFQEWSGYGVFFLVVASLQALYGLGLLLREARLGASSWYLVAGLLGNLFVIEVYAVSRVLGVHFLGPHAGHVEEIGALDVLSKSLELGLVATLAAMLVRLPGFKPSFGAMAKLVMALFLGVSVALVLAGVSAREEHEPVALSRGELLPLLTRGGYGPGNTSLDVRYAPPLLFQVEKDEPPASSLERPTAIFFMFEADHEHDVGLPPQPPQLLLRVDGGELIEPYEVTVLRGSAEGEHRTSRLSFPLPSGLHPATIDREEHTLTLVSPLGSVGDRWFSWQLPLSLGGEATAAVSSTSLLAEAATLPTTEGLTRTVTGITYGGKRGLTVQATYATKEYFEAALPAESALRYLPGDFTAFAVSETAHTSTLPDDPATVLLRLDGQTYQPDMVEQVVTSSHHRVTLVRFPAEPPEGSRHRIMELVLPQGEPLIWHLPLINAGIGSASGFHLTWATALGLFGGLLAAMWPCLFQLTVFFIPGMAGISMSEARKADQPRAIRGRVIMTALFFVLGIVIVYTLAGAAAGLAAQSLSGTSVFETWRRPLTMVAGLVIIFMAIRVAVSARAPLVCKMPIVSHMGHRGPLGPLATMVTGLAFATGCMTCFGAALALGMLTYVVSSASWLSGAFLMFLFSLGISIPLVAASVAMARALPLLDKLEQFTPWMALASSTVMIAFALLLMSDNYHLVSYLLAQISKF